MSDDELFDPFADDAEEAPVQEPAPKKTTTRKTTTKKAASVTDQNDANTGVTVTLKGGTGFDAPWVVIHAASLAEADEILDDEQTVVSVTKKAQAASKAFQDLAPAHTNTTESAPARTPARQEGPEGTKSCKHGVMQFKSGFSQKTGKAWSAYMCPTPKGTPDQCPAEFLRN